MEAVVDFNYPDGYYWKTAMNALMRCLQDDPRAYGLLLGQLQAAYMCCDHTGDAGSLLTKGLELWLDHHRPDWNAP